MKQIIIDNKKTGYWATEDGQIYNEQTKRYLKGSLNNNGYRKVTLN